MTGTVSRRSSRGVEDTVVALLGEIRQRGAATLAVVDHATAARAVGLDLPPTQVIIFGNPTAGTPLMQVAPDVGLDLPLRVLVREDGEPGSLVTWQDPDFVAERFGLDNGHQDPLRAVEAIVTSALAP